MTNNENLRKEDIYQVEDVILIFCLFHQANLQYLVELSPVILHLGEAGLRLLTR